MPNRSLLSQTAIAILLVISAALTGCPDYSHQRPVPDYENMVDGGGTIQE